MVTLTPEEQRRLAELRQTWNELAEHIIPAARLNAAGKMRQRCAEVAARHAKELLERRHLSERDESAADMAETIEREILALPLGDER